MIDFAGTGNPVWIELPVPPSIEYEWIAKDELAPILSIRTTNAGGNETVTQIKYRDIYLGLDAGVNENTLNLEVGPNPVNNILFINGLNEETPYQLLSLEGKVIQMGTVNHMSAKIDVSELNTGIFLIHIGEGSQKFTKRIVKL